MYYRVVWGPTSSALCDTKSEKAGPQTAYYSVHIPRCVQPAEFASPSSIIIARIQICMMAQDNFNDEKTDVNYRGNKDPLERMLDMKDEQIRVLRNDLARKENQMDKKDKEAREEFLKELRDTLVKKDQEWMEKVEELRGQLGKGDHEVYRYNMV